MLLGITSNRSSVNVLLKRMLRVSALAIAVTASVPSGFLRVGILLLVFVLDLTYDQHFLEHF